MSNIAFIKFIVANSKYIMDIYRYLSCGGFLLIVVEGEDGGVEVVFEVYGVCVHTVRKL